jgi:thiamine pyrophosphate-dependent acetolactate synthase large subunit-like protein
MSGIAEALLDGIRCLSFPVECGVMWNSHTSCMASTSLNWKTGYQGLFPCSSSLKHPTIYKAYDIAMSGEPGPVFIDIPLDVLMYTGKVEDMPAYVRHFKTVEPDSAAVEKAADLIISSRFPMLYLGWGAVDAFDDSVILAEMLAAPVATSLQGKSSFPNSHPLFTSAGIGKGAKPSGQWALKSHDLLLCWCLFGSGSRLCANPPKTHPWDINRTYLIAISAIPTVACDGKAFIKACIELSKDIHHGIG